MREIVFYGDIWHKDNDVERWQDEENFWPESCCLGFENAELLKLSFRVSDIVFWNILKSLEL